MHVELDNPYWFGKCPVVTPMDVASQLAEDILLYQENGFLSLPENPNFLGLGVGMAYPELTFAERLGIPAQRITLLDKQFIRSSRPVGAPTISPESTTIEAGIFEFLTDPSYRDFSVVTMSGVEFMLQSRARAEALIKLLPSVLTPPAVVCAFPYGYDGVRNVWQENGFRMIIDLPIILAFDGPVNS